MNKDHSELVFVLDRSGSMAGRISDVIGGFNKLLADHKAAPGTASVTLVLFDDFFEPLCDGIDIKMVEPINDKQYNARGSTALNDSVAKTIDMVGRRLAATSDDKRPGRVLVTIFTDGLENASKEITTEELKRRIEHQKSKYSWDFTFVGTNMDALAAAGAIGIPISKAMFFANNTVGVAAASAGISSYAVRSRGLSAEDALLGNAYTSAEKVSSAAGETPPESK